MPEYNDRPRVHYVHRLSYTYRERLVGVFVLASILIVLALIFAKGRASYLFEDRILYHVYLENAQGITTESVVKVSGIQVGRVSSIDLSPDNKIHVTLFVYERFRDLIRADSRAELSKLSFVGDASIEISAGSPLEPILMEGAILPIDEPLSVNELIAELTPVMGKLRETLDGVSAIVAAIDPQAVKASSASLAKALENLQLITDKVASGQGAMGTLVGDESFRKNMTDSATSLAETLRQAEQRVTELKPLMGNANALTKDSRQLTQELGQLINESNVLVKQMNTAMSGVNVDLQQIPELIGRMQLLLDSTDATLQGIQRLWPISSAVDISGQSKKLEVQPINE